MAGFFSKILDKFSRKPKIDWDDLEETLIAGDMGIRLTMEIIDELQSRGRTVAAGEIVDVCRSHITELLDPATPLQSPRVDRPTVILMVGVNGVGKTTSSAKLSHYLQRQGHGVVLAAADTFRAAAIEQLQVWAERLDVPLVSGQYKADPSSVCYDGYQTAVKRGAQYLICDTAGRLHTRHNLMEELRKTARVVGREDASAPHETLLVIDATTGSNGLAQAREFGKVLDITGTIVTKLDGSGKGGVVVSVKNELGKPTKFIGTGETAEDFEPFDPGKFVSQIL